MIKTKSCSQLQSKVNSASSTKESEQAKRSKWVSILTSPISTEQPLVQLGIKQGQLYLFGKTFPSVL